MFEPIERRRTNRSLIASLLAHGGLMAAFAFHYEPTVVKISSIMRGDQGPARVTQVASASDELAFPMIKSPEKPSVTALKLRAQKKPTRTKTSTNRAEETTTRAGASYGSLNDGPEYGSEVRPALPYVFPDPPVSRDDLPPGLKGQVIVEITIDELGNVIDTKLLQGLHPPVDAKVIATLKTWRFRPATRDGRAIASKQDALFHYPS